MSLENLSNNTETRTKYIDSNHIGSPSLEDSYGSLNNLLKKILVEGLEEKIVDSLEYSSTTGLATASFLSDHGFKNNQVIEITGPKELVFVNQFRVLAYTSKSISFKLKEQPLEDLIATLEPEDLIKIKIAPLGYSIVYENTVEGVICFKNKSLKSPCILKVIDKLPGNGYKTSWAKYGRVVIGQSIDSEGNFLDNNKAPFWKSHPNSEIVGNGVSGEGGIHGYAKWDYAIYSSGHNTADHYEAHGTYPTDWRVVGDDCTFYLMIRSMGKNNYGFNLLGAGNYVPDNPEESFNICLQAKDGAIATNYTGQYNYTRTRNHFGVLNSDMGTFLYANIYGNVKQVTNYGQYFSQGLYISDDNLTKPWRSSQIKSLNPASGEWLTSHLLIKDSDLYLRGYHRGLKIMYGSENPPDGMTSKYGDLVLRVQTPMGSSENESMPLVFSLRDWEEV